MILKLQSRRISHSLKIDAKNLATLEIYLTGTQVRAVTPALEWGSIKLALLFNCYSPLLQTNDTRRLNAVEVPKSSQVDEIKVSLLDQNDSEVRINPVIRRNRVDQVYRSVAAVSGSFVFLVMALIGGFLLYRGIDALRISGWGFITESQWAPDMGGAFGIASLLPYTFSIAFVALFIAVPVSIATALFITEYAPRRIRRFLTATIDLLAAVPSLIYGLWGLFYLQPRIITLSKWLADNLGFVPFFKVNDDFGTSLGVFPSSTFVAGVIVSLMVIPICTSVMREVFGQAPPGEREGAMALGGTRWRRAAGRWAPRSRNPDRPGRRRTESRPPASGTAPCARRVPARRCRSASG